MELRQEACTLACHDVHINADLCDRTPTNLAFDIGSRQFREEKRPCIPYWLAVTLPIIKQRSLKLLPTSQNWSSTSSTHLQPAIAVVFPLQTRMTETVMRRKARECDLLPLCTDDVEVLWETDEDDIGMSADVWWRASVMELVDDHREGILATGKIRYVKMGKHDACVHEVEFLPGRLLRCSNPEEPDEENDNPVVSWRMAAALKPCDRGYSDNSDWDWEAEISASIPLSKRRKLGLTNLAENYVRCLAVQMTKMRRNHANLLLEFMKLRRQVQSNTYKLQGREEKRDDIGTVDRLMTYMKQRITLAMQKPLRKARPSYLKSGEGAEEENMHIDAVSCVSVKVKADCDMEEFEALARLIRSNCSDEDSIESVKFYPDFSLTQNPTLSDTEFFVTFSTFVVACRHLGIRSKADKLEMLQRFGSAENGRVGLMRILGNYVFDEDDGNECAIVLGQSCGLKIRDVSQEEMGGRRWLGIRENGTASIDVSSLR